MADHKSNIKAGFPGTEIQDKGAMPPDQGSSAVVAEGTGPGRPSVLGEVATNCLPEQISGTERPERSGCAEYNGDEGGAF